LVTDSSVRDLEPRTVGEALHVTLRSRLLLASAVAAESFAGIDGVVPEPQAVANCAARCTARRAATATEPAPRAGETQHERRCREASPAVVPPGPEVACGERGAHAGMVARLLRLR
jgi:hypothetical protein